MTAESARVLLAGEGATELGGWFRETVYREPVPAKGVLEALLEKAHAGQWHIADAIVWKSIRKFRAGPGGGNADKRNVAALLLMAREKGFDVVAFTRDSDGRAETVEAIRSALTEAAEGASVAFVGGCAEPCIEGWILGALGQTRSEKGSSGAAKSRLTEQFGSKSVSAYVDVLSSAELGTAPAFQHVAGDATGLLAWLRTAADVLGRSPNKPT